MKWLIGLVLLFSSCGEIEAPSGVNSPEGAWTWEAFCEFSDSPFTKTLVLHEDGFARHSTPPQFSVAFHVGSWEVENGIIRIDINNPGLHAVHGTWDFSVSGDILTLDNGYEVLRLYRQP